LKQRDRVIASGSRRAGRRSRLNENHVVLIHTVQSFRLQPNRSTDLRLELCQGRRLLIQKSVHNVAMSQYQQLLARKLPALSHYVPKDLVTDRLRSFDEAATFATRTRLTQQMFQ